MLGYILNFKVPFYQFIISVMFTNFCIFNLDEVFPGLGIFAQGTAVGDEPTYAVLFTWVITQGCCVIFRGSLDAVANFISALFCLSYAAVNLSAFLLEVSGTPNFRPKWR